MEDFTRRLRLENNDTNAAYRLLSREWLIANGLGGYASGTIVGAPTRRYHGLLIAALPAPLGRMVMLNHLSEKIYLPDGSAVILGGEERAENVLEIPAAGSLKEFRLEMGLPVWRYEMDSIVIEKHIHMVHMQNTIHITYHLISGEGPIRIELHPSMHFRTHEAPVSEQIREPYVMNVTDARFEIHSEPQLPPLRLYFYGERSAFTIEGGNTQELFYRTEAERGYESRGLLWTPGYMRAELSANRPATFVASTESWTTILALKPEEAIRAELERRHRLLISAGDNIPPEAAELIFAADQFIITPAGRIEDAARARAAGDEIRTVIAGYHWFTDWGRDTMISLEGLTLSTGRHNEAGWILRTFAYYIKDGLIPNLFPEGEKKGLYHTADATLWFFHALSRYLRTTNDRVTLRQLIPSLLDIVNFHLRGTRFGIGVDPNDGLLRQGQQSYQLTWMDAKVDDWVVTPRRGKAVEINALWYNALRLLEGWMLEENIEAQRDEISAQAQKVYDSFNSRFWYEQGGYLYDIVDAETGGNDASFRPNQLFSFSLDNPVLEQSHWQQVMESVKDKLLTPVGLRSLEPGSTDFKSKYFGDLRARDAAYHQGTVWAWLIGPFVDAYLKVYPEDRQGARQYLQGLIGHLDEACIGSISEIFDAETPFTPRGCIAQAWSVAETLRCYIKTS